MWPKWATPRTQPIALSDVLRYLVGVAILYIHFAPTAICWLRSAR
jgi:hypothetical protein